MKKFLLVSAILLAFVVTNAQTEKGKFVVGGTSAFSFSSTNFDGADNNYNTFNIGLNGGYFIMDNVQIGAAFGYQSEKFEEEEFDIDIDTNSTIFAIGARYYYQNFFGGLAFQSQKYKDEDALNAFNIEAGYAIFVNDFISINPSVVYSLGTGDMNKNNNTFKGQIGFAIYF